MAKQLSDPEVQSLLKKLEMIIPKLDLVDLQEAYNLLQDELMTEQTVALAEATRIIITLIEKEVKSRGFQILFIPFPNSHIN